MKKIYPFLLFFTACNTQESGKTITMDKVKIVDKKSLSGGCYVMIKDKDSANMQLEIKGEKVTGILIYKIFEKDMNKGTINGVINDSLLDVVYTFQSEGIISNRQIVFKIKDDTLREGYGEITENKNGVIFIDISTLQFHDVPFVKTSCK